MAYTDYSISQSYDPFEEERKRKEAQQAEMAQMNQMPGAPQVPGAPAMPEVPETPEIPGTPGIPGAPQVPGARPVSPQDLASQQQAITAMTQQPGVQVAGPMQQPTTDVNQYANYPDQTQNETQRLQAQAQAPLGQDQANRGLTATPGAQQQLAQQTVPFNDALVQSQGDQKKMWEIYNNSQYTPEQRQVAGVQLSDMMKQDYAKNQATQFIRNATPADLNKMLASRSSEGSWGKAIMYGLLGMEASQKDEAAKLGVGSKWSSQQVIGSDGQTFNALIKMRADGLPMEGYNAETGKQLSNKEMIAAANAGTVAKGTTTHTGKMQDMTTGEIYYEQTTPQGIRLVDNKGKIYSGASSNLRAYGIGSDVATKNQIQINELTNRLAFAGPTASAAEREKIIAESEAKHGALSPEYKASIRAQAPQPTGTVKTGTGQATSTPAVTTTNNAAPAPAPAAAASTPMADRTTVGATKSPMSGVNPQITTTGAAPVYETPGDREAAQGARKDMLKNATEALAGADKIVGDLTKTNHAIQVLKNENTNFGTLIHGTIPGEQTVGRVFKTQDYVNTQTVLDQVNKQAAINAKMLGTNPTDRDLQFVTSTKPDETWSAGSVEEWLRRSAEGTRRTLDFARNQVKSGGRFIPETPAEAGGGQNEKTIDGVTYVFDGKGWKKK